MKQNEKIIVSAYTGYLMCEFEDMHKYIEKLLGRPVYAHELADNKVQEEIHNKSRADFLKLCSNVDDTSTIGCDEPYYIGDI